MIALNFNKSDIAILKKQLKEYLHNAYKILEHYNNYKKKILINMVADIQIQPTIFYHYYLHRHPIDLI